MTEAVKTIKRKSKIRASGKDKAFLFFVYLFLTLSLLIVLLPLIYVVSASFSDSKAVVSGEVWLLPSRQPGAHRPGRLSSFQRGTGWKKTL